jgi:ATP-binding cassette subfamily B (MDR/TAP) protein 10
MRKPFDDEYILGLVWHQKKQIGLAFACLVVCTTSNLAAPVLTGMLMELLVQQKPVEDYIRVSEMQEGPIDLSCTYAWRICPVKGLGVQVCRAQQECVVIDRHCIVLAQVLTILMFGYIVEPMLTKVYMENMISAGEKVLATLRLELFRVLLMQKVGQCKCCIFIDNHCRQQNISDVARCKLLDIWPLSSDSDHRLHISTSTLPQS